MIIMSTNISITGCHLRSINILNYVCDFMNRIGQYNAGPDYSFLNDGE